MFFLAAGADALRILSSVFNHPLKPDHVCICDAEPIGLAFAREANMCGWDGKKLHTNLAPACMKEIHAWPSTSHDQQCNHHGCWTVPWSLLCDLCKS